MALLKEMKNLGIAITGLILISSPADAHSFIGEGGAYDIFVEGAGVVLSDIRLILPLIAVGLMVALWQIDGLISVWPAMIVGNFIGIPLAIISTTAAYQIFTALGLIVAIIAAVKPDRLKPEILFVTFVISVGAMMCALQGHKFLELPLMIYLGIIFGTNLTLAMSANGAGLFLRSITSSWAKIIIRALASWVAAMSLLILAANA
ncbi:MAG: hypothetical protein EBT20_18560 [Alphaproteobacteria bacterium]|nr:hypothetical protein [Alphaproteobacteria bacterium]